MDQDFDLESLSLRLRSLLLRARYALREAAALGRYESMRERRLRRGDRDRWRFGSRSDPWRSEGLLEFDGPVGVWGGGSRALLVIGERNQRTASRGTLEELSRGKHRHTFASLPRLVLISFRSSHCHDEEVLLYSHVVNKPGELADS